MYRKNIVYIGVNTIHGFRHPILFYTSWNVSHAEKGILLCYYPGLNTVRIYTLNMTEDLSGREENALFHFRNIA